MRVPAGIIAQHGAPRLKCLGVAAGADLEPFFAARRPHLDIVFLAGAETQIAGHDLEPAVGDIEFRADRFRLLGHRFKFGVAGFWVW